MSQKLTPAYTLRKGDVFTHRKGDYGAARTLTVLDTSGANIKFVTGTGFAGLIAPDVEVWKVEED